MLIVPFYAAVLGVLFFILSVRTIRLRRRLRVAVGDGGDGTLLRAMRAHANFAEYVPLALLLFYFAEVSGAPTVLAHLLGASLVIGRCSHAWGVSQTKEKFFFRVFGMTMSFTTILTAAAYILYSYASYALYG